GPKPDTLPDCATPRTSALIVLRAHKDKFKIRKDKIISEKTFFKNNGPDSKAPQRTIAAASQQASQQASQRPVRPGGGKSRLPEQETDFFRILMPQRRFHEPGGATAPDAIRFCGRPFFHVYRQ
uniref:hypothetical protein n=1 Tax=Alistipes shahii TaxID=328814 RepID=UPI003FEF6FA8